MGRAVLRAFWLSVWVEIAMKAALYVRVSTDGQTTENQLLVLRGVAERRGWEVSQVYEDAGVSGSKGREKRPGLDRMLKDAARGRFKVLMFWSIDRLGRSTAAVAAALAELESVGVAVYADKEAVDATTPHGRAMLQMAAVFAELERAMIVERVKAGLARARSRGVRLGRAPASAEKVASLRVRIAAGMGVVKAAREVGCGTGLAVKVRDAMRAEGAVAA